MKLASESAAAAAGTAPVDLLLLMAASENDGPKLAELIRAGADLESKVSNGQLTYRCLANAARAHTNHKIIHLPLAQRTGWGCALSLQDPNGKTAKQIATSEEAQQLLSKPDLAYTY